MGLKDVFRHSDMSNESWLIKATVKKVGRLYFYIIIDSELYKFDESMCYANYKVYLTYDEYQEEMKSKALKSKALKSKIMNYLGRGVKLSVQDLEKILTIIEGSIDESEQ